MDDIPISLLFVLGALIILSAFFTSLEAAYTHVSKLRLRQFADDNKRGSKKAMYIVERLDEAIATVLLSNLVVTVAAVALATKLFIKALAVTPGLILSIVVMVLVLWVVATIIPRTIGKVYADGYVLLSAAPLYYWLKLMTPVNIIFGGLQRQVTKMLSKQNTVVQTITEDELKAIVEISEEEGVLEKEERELVNRSLDFDEIYVGEVFTPRPDMVAIEVNQSIDQIKKVFFKERLSRIPVYEQDIDNIIGILSEREFFSELLLYGTTDIRQLLRKPKFVVKSMQIPTLMVELQKSNVHMAIVIDEFGGTAGLITLEDILEQLVGEIWDEHDEVINLFTQIDETTYEVSPQIALDEFEKLLNIPPIESEFYNLGGWIFGNTDRIPQKGDTFEYEHVTLTIAEVEKKRVKKIIVNVHEPQSAVED
ncbi:hemolysin family protein [Paenibacillus yanchengensis]|uniref:Hemolysin family protein n=1 Tax=Paenibacillus yanchengensis TaxID=2035833 RepID=A0ABW4YP65_9BACL